MRHIRFEDAEFYRIAVLVKTTAFKQQEIQNNYVTPLNKLGVSSSDLIAFSLDYNSVGKAPAKFIKEQLDELLPALDSIGVKYLYVTDAAYFKVLTKKAKADPHLGYVLPCALTGYEHMNVVLGLNYQALIYNPPLVDKLRLSLETLAYWIAGSHQTLGSGIIHSAQYPETLQSIATALETLHQYPRLTCDIETYSLKFDKANIGTIAFAWDKHNGIAFAVDYMQTPEYALSVKRLLKQFFTTYKGEVIYHNSSFDVKVLIFELWMKTL